MEKQSLIKVLTAAGVGSRRKMSEAIKLGRVMVNGEAVTDFNHPVDMAKDKISIDGREVSTQSQKLIYIMMNKPVNTVSTVSDELGRRTVLDLLPQKYRQYRLYPVGRLDKDSTGLILLTNDGELANRLTHPRFENEKEYSVSTNVPMKAAEMRRMEKGIMLEDGMTYPAIVKRLKGGDYSITIHEGRKHQVRRMFEAMGYTVKSLKRIRMGNLQLGSLAAGRVRELRQDEVDGLISQYK
ncbi:MAG: rRNA pseudouridine synthase [Dehalococcoidales bacterium]|nr:rRNA pseudouridine synthase [Dehalococcoidales bacterium]